MNAPLRINPYLSGNFAPIRSEDDFVELSVEGEIPQEPCGTLYRNGPNPNSNRAIPAITGLRETG
jgi:carotenoid cleavage dioxygenase-like enzyme